MAVTVSKWTRTNRRIICSFWLQGRCNRNPCRFLHGETPSTVSHSVGNNVPCNGRKRSSFECENFIPKRKLKASVWNRTEVVETIESSSPTLSTEVVEAAESSSPTLSTEVVEAAESSPPTLSTEVVEVGESSSPTLSTEVVEAAQSSLPTLSTEVVEAAQNSSPTLSIEVVEAAESSSPTLSTEVVEAAQSSLPTLSTEVVEAAQSSSPTLCKYWIKGNCVHGDKCRDIHSWFSGDCLSAATNLEGHKKLVSGITLPVGTNKLCSGSTDGTVRTWDCESGQCANVINLGAEVNSLISEGPWIFVGLSNIVLAWNIQTGSHYTLDGPNGRVLAMTVGNDTLLAGAEDGVISAWRGSSQANSPFKLVASLRGHAKSVVCLTVRCLNKKLFSGSMDHSIKVWDLDTFECKMTLNGHTDTVTSLICWGNFLLSSSLDCTIKVWAESEEKTLQVAYSHNVENGIVALNEMTDAEDKPILLCSCRDNSVRLYELPSFSERGRLFARQEVRSIEKGPGGLIFTGDGTGLVTVSKWSEETKVEAA